MIRTTPAVLSFIAPGRNMARKNSHLAERIDRCAGNEALSGPASITTSLFSPLDRSSFILEKYSSSFTSGLAMLLVGARCRTRMISFCSDDVSVTIWIFLRTNGFKSHLLQENRLGGTIWIQLILFEGEGCQCIQAINAAWSQRTVNMNSSESRGSP